MGMCIRVYRRPYPLRHVFEDAITFEGDDGNEETEPLTPQLRGIGRHQPSGPLLYRGASGGGHHTW